jgi:DNA-binding CsgD family transcriptional regulator
MDSFVSKTDVNPGSASDNYDLTSREIQILRHLALGKSDKDISVDLNISVKTVNAHVGKIILKLKVNNRTHAVAKALVIKQIEMRASDSPPTQSSEKRKVARTNVFKIRGISVKRSDDD